MSDFIPNDPRNTRGRDPYGNAQFDTGEAGNGSYILLAVLVAVGLFAGLIYFDSAPKGLNDTARAPDRGTAAQPTPALPPGAGTARPAPLPPLTNDPKAHP